MGININRDQEKQITTLNQTEYTEKILERFGMRNFTPKRTPMESRQVQRRKTALNHQTDLTIGTQQAEAPIFPYREAIGSLLYLAGGTRADIAYSVNALASRQVSPTMKDWEDVLRIFQYLRGTSDYNLTYTCETDTLEAFTDTCFNDWTDSTSTGAFMIKLFGNVIAWKSFKQKTVCKSTTKAEYSAMSEACSQLIFLDKAARDITGKTFMPFTIWCDNQAAGKNSQKEGCHKLCDFDDPVETVQANLRFREETGVRPELSNLHGDLIKQKIKEKVVKVKWIPTKQNPADIFTKSLEFQTHHNHTTKIFKL